MKDKEPASSRVTFSTVVASDWRRGVIVPVPIDPDGVWGRKTRHHVAGTINGHGFRGVVERMGDGHGITLGPAWRRDCAIVPRHQAIMESTSPSRAEGWKSSVCQCLWRSPRPFRRASLM